MQFKITQIRHDFPPPVSQQVAFAAGSVYAFITLAADPTSPFPASTIASQLVSQLRNKGSPLFTAMAANGISASVVDTTFMPTFGPADYTPPAATTSYVWVYIFVPICVVLASVLIALFVRRRNEANQVMPAYQLPSGSSYEMKVQPVKVNTLVRAVTIAK